MLYLNVIKLHICDNRNADRLGATEHMFGVRSLTSSPFGEINSNNECRHTHSKKIRTAIIEY